MRWIILIAIATAQGGCASPQIGGSGEVRFGRDDEASAPAKEGPVTQAELQEDLQRFAAQLIDRYTPVFGKLSRSPDPEVRQASLRHALRLSSSALAIATETFPEIGLLDMIVFVRLNREILEEHWVPKVYGTGSHDLVAAFAESEAELAGIANKVLSREQQRELHEVIRSWRKEHPGQVSVEWIRLSDFSRMVGALETERTKKAGGLLSSVRSAVSAADQALLLANHAMFLGQRMPFLLRMQARLGAQEILTDSFEQLGQAGDMIDGAEPMVQDLAVITSQLGALAGQAGPLMADFRRHFPRDPSATFFEKMSALKSITGNLMQMTGALDRLSAQVADGRIEQARETIDSLLWSIARVMLLVGAGWAFVWWGGYYLAKRFLLRLPGRLERGRAAQGGDGASSGGKAA